MSNTDMELSATSSHLRTFSYTLYIYIQLVCRDLPLLRKIDYLLIVMMFLLRQNKYSRRNIVVC